MRNKIIFAGIALLMLSGKSYTQTFKDIYQKSIDSVKKVDFPYLREADAIWSKRVFRIIDLRQKANESLYYPKEGTNDGRQNFASILLNEINKGHLTAYNYEKIADTARISATVSSADIDALMGSKLDTIYLTDPQTGARIPKPTKTQSKPEEIKQLELYEEWYFDKKLSTLNVRIIGICLKWLGADQSGNFVHRPLFYVRYEEARDVLARKEAFNPNNDAQRISFDDLFMQRRFDSYIIGESNVYNDRNIPQYLLGKEALFEAEKIKTTIFNFEHDLWEY